MDRTDNLQNGEALTEFFGSEPLTEEETTVSHSADEDNTSQQPRRMPKITSRRAARELESAQKASRQYAAEQGYSTRMQTQTPTKGVEFKMPIYAAEQLKIYAATHGKSQKALIIDALEAAGIIEVKEIDKIDSKKMRRTIY